MSTQTPITLPLVPWYANRALTAIEGADAMASVHDANGGLIAIIQPGPAGLAALLALAPELLADLAALLRAVIQMSTEYRCDQGIALTDEEISEAMIGAVSQAVATLAHARDAGLPVDVPGLAQLEETL